MSGHPESEADSMEVKTRLNGTFSLKTYVFVGDDGHEMTVAESLDQAVIDLPANVIPMIQLSNGNVKPMDRTRRILDYVNDLIDGTLLLDN